MNRPSTASFAAIKAVMILLGYAEADITWENAKKAMNNPKTFKQTLVAFDKDNIPDKRMKKVLKLTESEDFNAEKVVKSSKAAASFTQWVLALAEYHKANKGQV